MNLRQDLLELMPESLTALANPGFVKRAQKDIAAGQLPSLSQDVDGTVHALFEDRVRTQIGPRDSLRDAACTCAASGMCRHRVSLVLAYQVLYGNAVDEPAHADLAEDNWSPAQYDDDAVAAVFSPTVIEQARKLALTRPLATVLSGSTSDTKVPSVNLPMSHVRFFSRNNLAHARCDCQQGVGCVHVVLAIWACRQARQLQIDEAGGAEINLEISPFGQIALREKSGSLMQTPAAITLVTQLQAWLCLIWNEGSAQPLLGLEARYVGFQEYLAQQGWTWVMAEVETVWQMLQAQERRSNRFDSIDLLNSLAKLWGCLQAANHADSMINPRLPASQILGVGQKGEVALDLLRLISLGTELWRDDVNEGASLVFADPDTQSVLVLERSWRRLADSPDSPDSLLKRRLSGQPLKSLASAQLVTKAAKRRANATLELGGNTRQTSVLPLSPSSWNDLQPPLQFTQLNDLLQYLANRPPSCLRPGQVGSQWQVLSLSEMTLMNWSWDAAQQTLFARWVSFDHITLCWYLPYQHLTPGAVDTLARALSGEWGSLLSIAGPVWLESGGIGIRPMSVLTQQRAIVLALETGAPQKMTLQEIPLPGNARQALLRETQGLLAQHLRQGLRHAAPPQRTRWYVQAKQLADAGYPETAVLMNKVFSDGASRRNTSDVESLAALSLLLSELLSEPVI